FSWLAGSATVFLYDNATGVWRSNDRGKTWARIWAKPSPSGGMGHLAADPADPTRLYVAVAGAGVYRLDGATAGSVGAGITPVEVGSFDAPGPLALSGGFLYATESAGPTSTPALRRSGDRGTTWEDLTDGVYPAAAPFP